MMGDLDSYPVQAIGIVRSPLKDRNKAPNQGSEGAPDARIELAPSVEDGLDRIEAGDELIIITWLHESRRDVLKTHPRGDESVPLTGVFATRSPDRPNPLGLHPSPCSKSPAASSRWGHSKQSTEPPWSTSSPSFEHHLTGNSPDYDELSRGLRGRVSDLGLPVTSEHRTLANATRTRLTRP
jgi:tRNA-Thr(GGU) m(6)t(6)A37 methyltransferase TsaA